MADRQQTMDFVQVLTEEEELAGRRLSFAKLRSATLFDLGGKRHFIAVKQVSEESWEVIELTELALERIIASNPPQRSILHFDEMTALNVR